MPPLFLRMLLRFLKPTRRFASAFSLDSMLLGDWFWKCADAPADFYVP